MTDPIADMLTRIRNATIARHTRVDIPASTLKLEIAKILELEGYIQSFKTVETPDGEGKSAVQKTIRVQLKYGPRGERVITGIQRVSRPGSMTTLASSGTRHCSASAATRSPRTRAGSNCARSTPRGITRSRSSPTP